MYTLFTLSLLGSLTAFSAGREYGSCCYPSGECAWADCAECEAAGGWCALGEPCEGIYCWPAEGACCLPDGSCGMATEEICVEYLGGTPYEPGTPCEAAHCVHSPGDLNCDGVANSLDIDPFVLALTDQVAYTAQFPGCDYMLADVNCDGVLNAFDVDPFVHCVTSGGCAACP